MGFRDLALAVLGCQDMQRRPANVKYIQLYGILHIVDLELNNMKSYFPACLNIKFTLEPHNPVVYCCCCRPRVVVCCCCVLLVVVVPVVAIVVLVIVPDALKCKDPFSFARRLQIVDIY